MRKILITMAMMLCCIVAKGQGSITLPIKLPEKFNVIKYQKIKKGIKGYERRNYRDTIILFGKVCDINWKIPSSPRKVPESGLLYATITWCYFDPFNEKSKYLHPVSVKGFNKKELHEIENKYELYDNKIKIFDLTRVESFDKKYYESYLIETIDNDKNRFYWLYKHKEDDIGYTLFECIE